MKPNKKKWEKPFLRRLREELSTFLVDYNNCNEKRMHKIESALSLIAMHSKDTSDLQWDMELILEKYCSLTSLKEKKEAVREVFEKVDEIERHSWDIKDEELEKKVDDLKEMIVNIFEIKDTQEFMP